MGCLGHPLQARSAKSCTIPESKNEGCDHPRCCRCWSLLPQVFAGYVTGIMGDEDNSEDERIGSVCEILSGATEEVYRGTMALPLARSDGVGGKQGNR